MGSMFDNFTKEEEETSAPVPPKKARKVAQEPKAKGPKAKGPKAKVPKVKVPKKPRAPKAVTAETMVSKMLKSAGLDALPALNDLFASHEGVQQIAINDIAVFIGDNPGFDEKGGDVFAELAATAKLRNTVNLSTEVTVYQTLRVGNEILADGKMWSPIRVARLTDGSRNLECICGRHRLSFLALAYGPDTIVPVIISNMSTQDARSTTIVANRSRRVRKMEEAEHAVLLATGGKDPAAFDKDELYAKAVTSKKGLQRYLMVGIDQGYIKGTKLPFKMTKAKRKGMVSEYSLTIFLKSAVQWNKEMKREEVETSVRDAIKFLAAVHGELAGDPGFDASTHMSTKSMGALGCTHDKLRAATAAHPQGTSSLALSVAACVMDMDGIPSMNQALANQTLYTKICEMLKGASA